MESGAENKFFVAMQSNFVRWVLKKFWPLFITGALAGTAGVFYAYFKPVIFQSKLVFVMDEGGSGGGGNGLLSIASQFGLSLGDNSDVFGGDNILTIIKSRRMIENTLLSTDTFDKKPQTLINYFINKIDRNKYNSDGKVNFPISQAKATFSPLQDSVLYRVYIDFEKEYIDIWKPDKYLNIFTVQVLSQNEKFAKIFTNRLVSETNDFYTTMRSKKARETLEILEQRVIEMKGNLNRSITDKAMVQDANVNPAFAAAQVPAVKNQTNIQTYGAAYAEMFKNLEVARYQYLKNIPLMQIIDDAKFPLKKIKAGKIKTGLIFSFVSVFLLIFIFWLKGLIRNHFLSGNS
jgi:hypothetical protein